MNEDGEVSGSSENEESEDEDVGEEEEAGSEDELENGNNKEEGEESASSATAPAVDKVSFSSSLFIYANILHLTCRFHELFISAKIAKWLLIFIIVLIFLCFKFD